MSFVSQLAGASVSQVLVSTFVIVCSTSTMTSAHAAVAAALLC
jgi:hypothetical protein